MDNDHIPRFRPCVTHCYTQVVVVVVVVEVVVVVYKNQIFQAFSTVLLFLTHILILQNL